MATRLSSLLVRDGIIGVKRMEAAFQRQVIYGGALDTILLEMRLVPEERLSQYLSLATGLPPATRSETQRVDPRAVELCPRELSIRYDVAPLAMDGEALRVLVCDPVDLSDLEELANLLEVPVQPLVAPEYRLHSMRALAFGEEIDARFSELLTRADEELATPAVGRRPSVIIEDVETTEAATFTSSHEAVASDGMQVAPPPDRHISRADRKRMFRETAPVEPSSDQRSQRQTDPIYPANWGTKQPPITAAPSDRGPTTEVVQQSPLPAANVSGPVAVITSAAPSDTQEHPIGRTTQQFPLPRLPAAPRTVGGAATPSSASATALSPEEAVQLMNDVEDRDEIFWLLLRALRSRCWFAGLLTVQGGAAIGRIAIVGDKLDNQEIKLVLVPIEEVPAFEQTVSSGAPYIGPVTTSDPEVADMLRRLGGIVPTSALLLPIQIRDRIVAIALAHRGADPLDAADLSMLFPLAQKSAQALSRMIVKSKALGYRTAASAEKPPQLQTQHVPAKVPKPTPPTEPAAPPATPTSNLVSPQEPGTPDVPPIAPSQDYAAWTTPTEPTPEVSLNFASQVTAPSTQDIERVLDRAESVDPDISRGGIEEALARPDDTLQAILRRFPGRLRMARNASANNDLPKAAQHGALLEIIVHMGSSAAPVLLEKLSDPRRDTRYFATLCAVETRPRSAIDALIDRLFDNDFGVRSLAIEALAGYPSYELEARLEPVRRQLYTDDPRRVQAAANAVDELGDVLAIPALIDVLQLEDDGSPYAQRALMGITKTTFGTSVRKWRTWWSKNRQRHRIEWMIEGLSHKDAIIRQSAADDLRTLTGEYFGYHYDLPKRSRDSAARRWSDWWQNTGKHGFAKRARAYERGRPTALLPGRLPNRS